MNRLSTGSALPPQLAMPSVAPKGAKAARDFEANLIASLLESLEKTFANLPGEDSLPGGDDYNYLGTQALASGLAARGGFGIAALIEKHLPHEGKG
jgi:Rod binding domain-containing protein